ncbi:hypothetical protein B0T24DRAFT_694261 [Lasiosphaeria ovina]|uniref:Protein kinase domain-containing protein n=1 Tax=Lasiosphaeria ovina TaxID=92902 RepID=A0AAE0KLP8_9PEZI|nr:hypothetical protein B0T24DRAFT_694261 [Lasiosphaeria ovina]
MSQPLPDIVVDTNLETEIQPGHTIHYIHGAHSDDDDSRPRKIPQRWRRERNLGRGSFGTVWLERCTSRLMKDQDPLRAVKVIKCRTGGSPSSECARELEAIGKFSQEPYRHYFVQSFEWYETNNIAFVAMNFVEHGGLKGFMGRCFSEIEAIAQKRRDLTSK